LRTATTIPSYTPTAAASVVYYMFILDASAHMQATFDGVTLADAAREAAQTMLAGLEPSAQYGLITLGASALTEGADPCNEPSVARMPFSARAGLAGQVDGLQPLGGGSLEAAFGLARRQFEGLPANVVRVFVVITAAQDACPGVDEWQGLEKQVQALDEAGVSSYTSVLVLDEKNPVPAVKAVADRFARSKRVAFQFPTTSAALQAASADMLANIGAYVTSALAAFPTATVPPATHTPDTAPTNTLSASSFTLTPRPGTATFTPTITNTPLPVSFTATRVPSITPTATATLAPKVQLTSYTFVTTGSGCQIDVLVKVTGSPATGVFHVLHAGNGPLGDVYPVTLPVGSYNNNHLTLTGNTSATYTHEVWFEYEGGESNRLKNLVCPLLPTSTPTP
jgi:hypothetical protein